MGKNGIWDVFEGQVRFEKAEIRGMGTINMILKKKMGRKFQVCSRGVEK